jgi:hypothetical protein
MHPSWYTKIQGKCSKLPDAKPGHPPWGDTVVSTPLCHLSPRVLNNQPKMMKKMGKQEGQDRVQRWDLPALGAVIKLIHRLIELFLVMFG